MPKFTYLNRSCFKKEGKRPHATFPTKHKRKSDTQQNSYTAAMAERDVDSTDDTEVLGKKKKTTLSPPRKTADHLRQRTASMEQP